MNQQEHPSASVGLGARLVAFGQLLRVANVFTAVADVWMALLLTTGTLPWPATLGITATSVLLYLAGMVLNDVHDHQVDARERPERPIPSGRVSLRRARVLGWLLLVGGLAAGWWVTTYHDSYLTGIMATLLAILVLAYDGGLKATLAGPAVMALCRVANVLLGMSLAAAWGPEGLMFNAPLVPAVGIGLYIFSITWFARYEAQDSPRWLLMFGTLGVVASLALLAAMPWIESPSDGGLRLAPGGWLLLWGVVGAIITRRMVVAVLQPQPRNVQRAVGHAILLLIVIDAALVLGYATPFWSLAVLLLVVPSSLLSHWFKVT